VIDLEKRELPDGWRWAKLGEIASYINGRAFKPDEWSSTGLPIIRIQNLNDSLAPFNYFEGKADPSHLVIKGDLLVSWSASLDAFIWSKADAVLNQHIFKVIEDQSVIDKNYLYFALREVMTEIRKQTHGATMKHITKPEFESIEIPLPSLAEQQRIAAILTDQLAAVEQARKASEARLEAAGALPAAYLREVFESEEAKGWPRNSLNKVVVEFRYGTSAQASMHGFITLRIPNIIGGKIDLSDLKSVLVERAEMEKLRLVEGDILFVRTNGNPNNLGRSAVYERKFFRENQLDPDNIIFASYLIRARLIQERINPYFLQYYLQTKVGLNSILSVSKTTAGQYNLNTRGLGEIRIPIPRLKEQDEVVSWLNQKYRYLGKACESLYQELTTRLLNLRQQVMLDLCSRIL